MMPKRRVCQFSGACGWWSGDYPEELLNKKRHFFIIFARRRLFIYMKRVIYSFSLILLLAQGILFSLVFMCIDGDPEKEALVLYTLLGVPGAKEGAKEDWNSNPILEERAQETFHLLPHQDAWVISPPMMSDQATSILWDDFPTLSLSTKVIVPPPERV